MKRIFIILVSTLFITATNAQNNGNSLPESTAVIPYKLEVGYNTTTLVIFPMPLVPSADRGSKEIIIQKEKELSNVLKVKADKKDFHPTNMHIYTIDGKLYVFNVTYTEYPNRTTFDLGKLSNDSNKATEVIIEDALIKKPSLREIAFQARQSKSFFSRKTVRYDMKLQLRTIHIYNDWLIFGFQIVNQSNLDYDIDFIRTYIKDKKQAKRSSIQEQEILPVYKDNFVTVTGEKKEHFMLMVPKFTIPDKKEFLIEMFEKNGGRNINFKIKNKQLLKAKTIEHSL